MKIFEGLCESFLIEATALTKGSQRVMANKNLVRDLADTMRDESRSHPGNFPLGSNKTFQKTPDEELARWFLESIDAIEKEGYEGTVYSRDGVNNEWIVRRYIAGSHNWEDLTGVMNMNLRDWYGLKNRSELDARHSDLLKFKSVRDVGAYMNTHYKSKLERMRDASKNAARNKLAKSVKLVDNDDYRIYTTLNRAAGCALGLGTQWCTANSNSGAHFHSYTAKAMMFQLFVYAKTPDISGELVNITDTNGKKELNDQQKFQFDAGGPSFMDILDHPVRPEFVKKQFPFLYTDLSRALLANKEKIEKAFEELSIDPTLQHDDFKIKTYDLEQEIKKLNAFRNRGYFTDLVRPPQKPIEVKDPKLNIELKPEVKEDFMTSIRELAEEMLQEEDVVAKSKIPAKQRKDTGDKDWKLSKADLDKEASAANDRLENRKKDRGITKEEIQMDKDVKAMLRSLKQYDKLNESIFFSTLSEKKPDWLQDSEKNAEKKEGKDTCDEEDADEKEDVKEGADRDVIEWMKRFAKLGDMKGYGR